MTKIRRKINKSIKLILEADENNLNQLSALNIQLQLQTNLTLTTNNLTANNLTTNNLTANTLINLPELTTLTTTLPALQLTNTQTTDLNLNILNQNQLTLLQYTLKTQVDYLNDFIVSYYQSVALYIQKYFNEHKNEFNQDTTLALTQDFNNCVNTGKAVTSDKLETVQTAGEALSKFFNTLNDYNTKIAELLKNELNNLMQNNQLLTILQMNENFTHIFSKKMYMNNYLKLLLENY